MAKLTFRVPVAANVYLEGLEPLPSHKTEFAYRGFRVIVELLTDTPFSTGMEGSAVKMAARLAHLDFTVEEVPELPPRLSALSQEETSRPNLRALVCKIADRVVRSIRTYGFVPGFSDPDIPRASDDYIFDHWDVHLHGDDGVVRRVFERPLSSDLLEFFARMPREPDVSASFLSSGWDWVVEAIQDGKAPYVEREFVLNAISYLRQGNNRLAVVEAVIALEIAVTQFLRSHLEPRLTNEQIEAFLGPQFGLRNRVLFLQSTLFPHFDKKNVQPALSTITWRNGIVHGTGELPRNVESEVLRARVFSTLTFANELAGLARKSEEAKRLRALDSCLPQNTGTSVSVAGMATHRYEVTCSFDDASRAVPSFLNELSRRIAKGLLHLDPRLKPLEHLKIEFRRAIDSSRGLSAYLEDHLIATWEHGELVVATVPQGCNVDLQLRSEEGGR